MRSEQTHKLTDAAQRQYFMQFRQNFLKTIGVLLIRNYVWCQVLFGRAKRDTQRQSINYRVLVSAVCISIAGLGLMNGHRA
jgi:hypothetical protein